MYGAFDLIINSSAQASTWGTNQDLSNMDFVHAAIPFVAVNFAPATKYSYDLLGQLIKTSFPNGMNITTTYDLLGNRLSVVTD